MKSRQKCLKTKKKLWTKTSEKQENTDKIVGKP